VFEEECGMHAAGPSVTSILLIYEKGLQKFEKP
jgi:hypothetical protein